MKPDQPNTQGAAEPTSEAQLAAAQGYASLTEMPTDMLQRNIRWAARMEKAWGAGKATDRLHECVRDWQKELERRGEA